MLPAEGLRRTTQPPPGGPLGLQSFQVLPKNWLPKWDSTQNNVAPGEFPFLPSVQGPPSPSQPPKQTHLLPSTHACPPGISSRREEGDSLRNYSNTSRISVHFPFVPVFLHLTLRCSSEPDQIHCPSILSSKPPPP